MILKQNYKEKINSIGLAIFLCAKSFVPLYTVEGILVGISLMSFLFLIFANSLYPLFSKKNFIIVGVILLFFMTYIFIDFSPQYLNIYFYSFLIFGCVGLFYSNVEFDYDVLFKSIFIISIVAIPGIIALNNRTFTDMSAATDAWMTASQNCLRLIIGLILVLPIFKKTIYKIAVIALMIFYLIFYFKYGTRGAILGLIVFLGLYFMLQKKVLTTKNLVLLIFSGLIIARYFDNIIFIIQDALFSIGIEIKALDKMVEITDQGADMSNGRSTLWGYGWKGFVESPIVGNGIGVFRNIYGQYVHNVLLQVMYEGGIIYFLPILVTFIRFFSLIASSHIPIKKKKILLYVFCSGIMEVMFSNVYWRTMAFWFFIGYVWSVKPEKPISKSSINYMLHHPEKP